MCYNLIALLNDRTQYISLLFKSARQSIRKSDAQSSHIEREEHFTSNALHS